MFKSIYFLVTISLQNLSGTMVEWNVFTFYTDDIRQNKRFLFDFFLQHVEKGLMIESNNVKPKGKSIAIYYEKLWSLFCHCLCGD